MADFDVFDTWINEVSTGRFHPVNDWWRRYARHGNPCFGHPSTARYSSCTNNPRIPPSQYAVVDGFAIAVEENVFHRRPGIFQLFDDINIGDLP